MTTKREMDPTWNIVLDHPTGQWTEGLPMGNGVLGLMVYGSSETFTLALNHNDVWDHRIGPRQGLPEEFGVSFDEMVEMTRRGEFDKASALFPDWLDYENCSGPSMQPAGQLDLVLLPGERTLSLRQRLDLQTARAHIHADCAEYREHKQAIDIRAFVPARADVIPVTLANLPGKKLFGKLRLWRQPNLDAPLPRAWVDGDAAGLDMVMPGGVRYTLAVRALGAPSGWECTRSEAVLDLTPVEGPVVLLTTIVASTEADDPHAAALARLAPLDAQTPARLQADHEAWWADFWGRSAVTLPDEAFQRHWRIGLYMFGSSSRPGRQCPGLQGVWNRYNRPPWHTDFHADGNVEILHWSAYTSNHMDLLEPFYRLFTEDMREECRRAAREFFHRRGLYIPIAGGPRGHELAGPWMWPGAGAWIALHFWWHWLYTRDVEFLRRVWPFLKELSLFYEDFLHKNDRGTYDFGPSFSPEMMDPRGWLVMVWGNNPTIDLALVRVFLTALIEGSRILGLDDADRARWTDLRDNLSPFPCALGTWMDLEGDHFAVLEPSICRIVPVYPAGLVGLGSSPELLDVAKRTYARIRGIYSSGGHCGIWCASAAAHMGDAAEALRVLRSVKSGWLDNGQSAIFQYDNVVAFPSAVNELLLQSLDGVLRLFPAVPADWADVSFSTLRAVGAFLVSASRRDGRTASVRVLSEAGSTCTLADPFAAGRAALRCADTGEQSLLLADSSGQFSFPTRAGFTYDLTPP